MTDTITQPATTREGRVTTTVADLHRLLQSVVPFVADDDHPALEAVHLEHHRGVAGPPTLTAQATDRYIAARARIDVQGGLLGAVLVSGADVRRVLDFIRPLLAHAWLNFDRDTAALEHTEGSDTVTFRFGTYALTVPATMPSKVGDFPNLEPILDGPDYDSSTLSAPIRFGLDLLARLNEAHPNGAGRSVWTFTDPYKPARVTVGNWWTAAIMPCRERES